MSTRLFGSLSVAIALLAASCSSSGDSSSSSSGSTGGFGDPSSSGSTGSSGSTNGSSGTTQTPTLTTRTQETFTFNGATRRYYLAVPKEVDTSRAYPMVMVLHGNPGTAEQMLGFPYEATTGKDAVVVYPNAAGSDWALYDSPDQNADYGYLKAVVDEVSKKIKIDKTKVFGSGWSGGGFMVSQTACYITGLFRAIAINAGGAPADPNHPNAATYPNGYLKCPGNPMATIVTHGSVDQTVEPASGEFAAMYWAYVNKCSDSLSDTTPSPCKQYDGCPAATPVHYCSIPGLDHPEWSESHKASWAFFMSLP